MKPLAYLAAAGMIGGMLHATPAVAKYDFPLFETLDKKIASCKEVSGSKTFENVIISDYVVRTKKTKRLPVLATGYIPTTNEKDLQQIATWKAGSQLEEQMRAPVELMSAVLLAGKLKEVYHQEKGEDAAKRYFAQDRVSIRIVNSYRKFRSNGRKGSLRQIMESDGLLAPVLKLYQEKEPKMFARITSYKVVDELIAHAKKLKIRSLGSDYAMLHIPPSTYNKQVVPHISKRGGLEGTFTITGELKCQPKEKLIAARKRLAKIPFTENWVTKADPQDLFLSSLYKGVRNTQTGDEPRFYLYFKVTKIEKTSDKTTR